MQPLIHKASVHMTSNTVPTSVSPGDPVRLQVQDDGMIAAILTLPSRLPFGLGKTREFVAGTLGQNATNLLRPALKKAAYLRVRVVEVDPAHLSRTGQISLCISVWGDPMAITAGCS